MPGLAELVAQFEARKAAIEMRSARYQANLLTTRTLIENFFVTLTTAGVTQEELEARTDEARQIPFYFESIKSLVSTCLSPEVNTIELLDAATVPLGMKCNLETSPFLYQNTSKINYAERANHFMDKLVYALSAYRACFMLVKFYDNVLSEMNNALFYKGLLEKVSLPNKANTHVLDRAVIISVNENELRQQYDRLNLLDEIAVSLAPILEAFEKQYKEGYSRYPNATALGKIVNSPFRSLCNELWKNIFYECTSLLNFYDVTPHLVKVDTELKDLLGKDGLVLQVILAYLAEASRVVLAQRISVREDLRKEGFSVELAETPMIAPPVVAPTAEPQAVSVAKSTDAFYGKARVVLKDSGWLPASNSL